MITLGWPSSKLSPNARGHWRIVAAAKATAKMEGFAEARRVKAPAGRTIAITFHAPDNRRRDLDNMLASVKAHLDGISDAIGVDDSEWTISIAKGAPVKGGKVIVEVKP